MVSTALEYGTGHEQQGREELSRPGGPPAGGLAALRHSPAEHLAGAFAAAGVSGERGVQLREVAYVTMISLRVDPASDTAAKLAEVLGTTLPAGCGQTATGEGRTVLWQGPDEFLVITDDDAGPLVQTLAGKLEGTPGSVVDVSANRTTLELSGPSARAVLEKSCALDLHPRAFAPGTAVSTVLAGVPAVLWQLEGRGGFPASTGGPAQAPTYRLMPRASFADYLGRWLIDGMAEFAAPEIPAAQPVPAARQTAPAAAGNRPAGNRPEAN
ncbi:sarcosine oxidase subunit gamma [Arthrobacter monumenti]